MDNVQLIRSKRKTLSVQISSEGKLVVRAPYFLSEKCIDSFLAEKKSWIEKSMKKVQARPPLPTISENETELLRKRAKETILPLVEEWSKKTGLSFAGAKITKARRSLGSCSGKNTLNFSLFLVLFPPEAIDYVIVHELCHTVHHNHSRDFYRLLARFYPDYQSVRKQIKSIPIPIPIPEQ